MKNKQKPRGMKHKIREEKKREQRIGLAVTVAILIVIGSVSGFLINSMLNQPSTNQTTSSASQPKAAIVDQLSLTAPNQTFRQTATNTLTTAGYTVDYYPGEKVTVEFYRNLPTHAHSLIVLRAHSALCDPTGYPLALFTSQNYSNTKYVGEQLTDRVIPVGYSPEDFIRGERYFGVTPNFVKQDMKGTFHNTTIIMMGCNGLTYNYMAQAFIEKGAKVYISWNGTVSASHTDQATTQLLECLITKKQTIKQAVTQTMKEVGSDLEYESILQYYPDTLVDNYIIPNIASNLTLNDATISG